MEPEVPMQEAPKKKPKTKLVLIICGALLLLVAVIITTLILLPKNNVASPDQPQEAVEPLPLTQLAKIYAAIDETMTPDTIHKTATQIDANITINNNEDSETILIKGKPEYIMYDIEEGHVANIKLAYTHEDNTFGVQKAENDSKYESFDGSEIKTYNTKDEAIQAYLTAIKNTSK